MIKMINSNVPRTKCQATATRVQFRFKLHALEANLEPVCEGIEALLQRLDTRWRNFIARDGASNRAPWAKK